MSVEYYIACHDCKTVIHIGTMGFSGWSFFSGEPECMKVMRDFVEQHTFEPGHRLEIVSEDSSPAEDYKELEWHR